VPPTKYLGRRGGAAHRQNLGVECQIWSCGGCGLIFPNPMPIPVHGPDQHYAVPPEEYFHHHEERDKLEYASMLMQQLQELRIEKGTLLDIGAGRGETLRVAREHGWEVTGIETSPSFAEYATRYSGAQIIQKPLHECGFNENTFDAVVLGAVLEHLYNPAEVVQEIARVLKPGGALFIDVPNERGLYFIAGNLYYRLRLRKWVVNLAPTFSPYHVFGFTPQSLKQLLAKYGLEPAIWTVFSGKALVPSRGGLMGYLEQQAAKLVTFASKRGEMGEYIATWAIKK
jgi:2-polyprenyl-3-methyl-5-hydroxy-6-metoxy-1,4-benzoquinol methylase